MANNRSLTIGTKFKYDGDTWKVEGFVGGNLKIRSVRGKPAVLAIGELVATTSFSFLDEEECYVDSEETATFPDNVAPELIKAAQVLLEHLNEVETGYKSGFLGTALSNEPVAAYDPEEWTLNQRIKTKATELGMGVRTLWGAKAAYKERGIYGLVDHRQTRVSTTSTDIRVVEALHFVVDQQTNKSNTTNQSIMRKVRTKLQETYPGVEVRMPSEATFNRLVTKETKNRGLRGPAKGRRSINNGPEVTYRRFEASRPGEMVLIDSTPLDAFGMDPATFKWIPIQLTIALDLYTRSLVGWRFTPKSVKGVDAALLLYDIIRPKAMLKGWPDSARWCYVGVPEYIVTEITDISAEHGIAGVPALQPDSIIIDHGKVFISNAFKDGCVRLGINLQLARPYTPTDKAHVERMFKTIRENFVIELPGYKGPDVYSRGLNIEDETFYFLDEIEEKFSLWVSTWWQRRPHEGVDLPGLPHIEMSPNDLYNEGIARAGFVHMVTTQNLYYELLPSSWRRIHNYGVELRGLRYDGDILNDFRHKRSPYNGVNKDKWPIRFDPRDLSVVYFYDHETRTWYELPWNRFDGTDRPFNEGILGYAKALLLTRGGNSKDPDELSETLNVILDGMHVTTEDRKLRKLTAINAIHSKLANRDRPNNSGRDRPDADAETSNGVMSRAPQAPGELHASDDFYAPVRDVDEALEDDDDDLGF